MAEQFSEQKLGANEYGSNAQAATGTDLLQPGYQPFGASGYSPQSQTASVAYAAYSGYPTQTAPSRAIGKGVLIVSGIVLLFFALLQIGWNVLTTWQIGYSGFNGDNLTASYYVILLGASILQSLLILATAIAAFSFAGKIKEKGGLIAWGGIGFSMAFGGFIGMLADSYYPFANILLDPSSFHINLVSILSMVLLIFLLLFSLLSLIFTIVMIRVGFRRLKSNDNNKSAMQKK